jgi:hypothetical protein
VLARPVCPPCAERDLGQDDRPTAALGLGLEQDELPANTGKL